MTHGPPTFMKRFKVNNVKTCIEFEKQQYEFILEIPRLIFRSSFYIQVRVYENCTLVT